MNGALVYLQALDEPEEDAAGWRLAGALVGSAGAGDAVRLLAEARRGAAMLVLSPGLARLLPAAQLDAALTALQPLAVLLPSDPLLPDDPAERVRRQLGLDTEAA